MGKKILFAVMALLVMATGKIWAEGETAYAVLCPNEGSTTYSMHFVYTTATENTVEGGEKEKTVDVTINGTTTSIKLTATNHWEITDNNPYEWQDPKTGLGFSLPSKITEVVFEESFKAVKVKNCYNWFSGFTSLTRIVDIKYLDTSEVTNMSSMFNGCEALTSLDLNSFKTSSVTDMSYMFRKCSGLKSLDLSNFDTSNVTDMMYMFYGCSGLTTLDLSSFVTSQVENMSSMFYGCSGLTTLTLSSFNTSQVGNMSSMFQRCKALTSLDLSSFNTSQVGNMSSMFDGCSSRLTLTIGSFDMSRTKQYNNMFDTNTYIKIEGNALVFVTSDAQKNIWEGITGVNLMVKKDGEDKYEGDGTVDITLDNNEDTPVIFPHEFKANSVTFNRKFTAGYPHTVCLPFAVNATEYGTFYKLSSYDKDNRRVKFTKVEDATEANKPYLFIPDKNKADVTEIKVTGGVAISSTKNGEYNIWDNDKIIAGFRGVYEKLTFTEEYLKNNGYDFYGWTSNSDGNGYFRKAGAGASVAPCRAYIRLTKGGAGIGSAPARLSVEFDDGETTGIDTIGTAVSGANGGADAPMYNLQGQRVSGGYKGVVIKNGKKMIVR